MKTCTVCNVEKPVADFYKRSVSSDGLDTKCKTCSKAHSRRWYLSKVESVKEKVRLRHIQATADLDDYYLRRLVGKDLPGGTKVPQQFIEVKRIQIQIARHIKEMK